MHTSPRLTASSRVESRLEGVLEGELVAIHVVLIVEQVVGHAARNGAIAARQRLRRPPPADDARRARGPQRAVFLERVGQRVELLAAQLRLEAVRERVVAFDAGGEELVDGNVQILGRQVEAVVDVLRADVRRVQRGQRLEEREGLVAVDEVGEPVVVPDRRRRAEADERVGDERHGKLVIVREIGDARVGEGVTLARRPRDALVRQRPAQLVRVDVVVVVVGRRAAAEDGARRWWSSRDVPFQRPPRWW
mmetsp:Transcript_9822/g.39940  ORF Transcript_9822/g.39940 Transcript_9822/m.39940 type:complete len:250 (-) Transcript_9822:97-846(-)